MPRRVLKIQGKVDVKKDLVGACIASCVRCGGREWRMWMGCVGLRWVG